MWGLRRWGSGDGEFDQLGEQAAEGLHGSRGLWGGERPADALGFVAGDCRRRWSGLDLDSRFMFFFAFIFVICF